MGARALRAIRAALGVAVLGWCSQALAADVFVGTPPLNPPPGSEVSIQILVDVASGTLGAYSFDFQYNPAVVTVVSIDGGTTPEFSAPPVTNPGSFTTGTSPLAAVQGGPSAPSGVVSVAEITLAAVGFTGAGSVLDLGMAMLFDGAGGPIPANVFASSVLIGPPPYPVPALSGWALGTLALALGVSARWLEGHCAAGSSLATKARTAT